MGKREKLLYEVEKKGKEKEEKALDVFCVLQSYK